MLHCLRNFDHAFGCKVRDYFGVPNVEPVVQFSSTTVRLYPLFCCRILALPMKIGGGSGGPCRVLVRLP